MGGRHSFSLDCRSRPRGEALGTEDGRGRLEPRFARSRENRGGGHMNTNLSAEEGLEHNRRTLGDLLGADYTELSNELSYLYYRWNQYRHLFGTSPERIELL